MEQLATLSRHNKEGTTTPNRQLPPPGETRTHTHGEATTIGAAAKDRDDQKYRKYNRAGSAVYRMVPLSHESYGRLGQPAFQSLNKLAILACC